MQLKLKTLLNSKENYPGFVYQDVRLKDVKDGQRIEVMVKPRQGSKGIKVQGREHLRIFLQAEKKLAGKLFLFR